MRQCCLLCCLIILVCSLLSDAGTQSRRRTARIDLAKAEPERGCYFSGFVGPDKSIRYEMFRNGGTLTDAFERIVQKKMAVMWLYFYYDNPAELEATLKGYKTHSFAMQVALEPRTGLQEVRDDATLRHYAKMMAAYGRPIFLRFASEMNGNWTPYHSNPALYRQKFRLVHDVMARHAPNVVMIWCVGSKPDHNWDKYYPGDGYVDWVGVNFYSVLHHNNDPKQPADKESVASMLDGVYRKYASRKPIAICEYGASRQERLAPTVDQSKWAAAKLTELLSLLPKKYPRVKMIGLFNVNTMELKFSTGAKANNYCFTDSPTVTLALRRALATDYYLSRVAPIPPPLPSHKP
jgi:hypothetical protein